MNLEKLFPSFTVTKKVMIDFDVNGHSVYCSIVIAEYTSIWLDIPVALRNSKGRKLPNLLRNIISENKLEWLETVN